MKQHEALREADLDEIQGIVLRGYGGLEESRFVLLQIGDPAGARRWLGSLADEVAPASRTPERSCVNVGFTREGLERLELDALAVAGFPRDFYEGIVSEHRSRMLGDHGDSAPERWSWGGPANEPVHAVLLLYAEDRSGLDALHATHRERLEGAGLRELETLPASLLPGRSEQFGFRDGIGQPALRNALPDALRPGVLERDAPDNTVAPGEFLLGYRNEYKLLPPSPRVDTDALPWGDLGRNGSYLVFRTLAQDVYGFWKFLDERSRRRDGGPDPAARLEWAAKMVGRWPNGTPLVLSPQPPASDEADDTNVFSYAQTDPHGHLCPFGSHIRRANPRDAVDDPDDSLETSKRHRIIRRARPYGTPLWTKFDPDEILRRGDPERGDRELAGEERGIHFLCFNANISRQFEFVQNFWINNARFARLYQDADPLMGDHDPKEQGQKGVFTAQGSPLRRRVTGLERFVHVRGGAYFFVPSLPALRYLARV